jgi:hypothetical protein
MNTELSLRLLGDVMDWTDDEARNEYRWLKFMADTKFDAYRDFQAGMRFTESLARWLQQFEMPERIGAYSFVKERLVFIGLGETHHLVEQFYPRFAHEAIVTLVADRNAIRPYEVYASTLMTQQVEDLRRRTLFLGLSDGARVDVLRHSNVGRLTNEQIVASTQLDQEKWQSLLQDLRKDTGDNDAKFELVYLVDDFTATGTSFLRYDSSSGQWKGKLAKFQNSIRSVSDELFASGWTLGVHHYMASHAAAEALSLSMKKSTPFFLASGWQALVPNFGIVLPKELPLSSSRADDSAFLALTDKYYDPVIETKHTLVGGTLDMKLGYGGCALPLVLEHNTPNNSLALLWADTKRSPTEGPSMRPLFRRRQRHV